MTGPVVDVKAAGARVLRFLAAMRTSEAANAYADLLEIVKTNNRMVEDLRQVERDRAVIGGNLRVIAAADRLREAHRGHATKADQYQLLDELFNVITVPVVAPKARGKK